MIYYFFGVLQLSLERNLIFSKVARYSNSNRVGMFKNELHVMYN